MDPAVPEISWHTQGFLKASSARWTALGVGTGGRCPRHRAVKEPPVSTEEPTNDAIETGAAEDGVSRRTLLRWGAIGGVGVGLTAAGGWAGPYLGQKGLLSADGAFGATSTALGDLLFYKEVFPTSTLILEPFKDALPIPEAMKPVPVEEFSRWAYPPGPGDGQQNSYRNERHQIWPSQIGFPDPIVYKINVVVDTHAFTKSPVLPINSLGQPTISFDATGKRYAAGTTRYLPRSTIYGFNGTFPGPRINAEYGKPCRCGSRTTSTRTR
jgi:hypothetical protein